MGVAANSRLRKDSRKKPRQHFHRSVSVLLSKDAAPLPCVIEDISESGARIKLDYEGDFPPEFFPLLTANGATRRRCRLAWRDGAIAGIEFTARRPG